MRKGRKSLQKTESGISQEHPLLQACQKTQHLPPSVSAWLNHTQAQPKYIGQSWQPHPGAVELQSESCFCRTDSLGLCSIICIVKNYFWDTSVGCFQSSVSSFTTFQSLLYDAALEFCGAVIFCSLLVLPFGISSLEPFPWYTAMRKLLPGIIRMHFGKWTI